MSRISFLDFLPPVLPKAFRYLTRKRGPKAEAGRGGRVHPFDAIPASVTPRWILDVGANVGDVTTAALNSFPGCSVICFEPVSQTYEILRDRLAGYPGRTFVYNLGLSDAEGEVEIHLTNFHGANSLSSQTRFHRTLNPGVREVGSEKVRIVRLDDIAAGLPAATIDVLKIDVEGHELSVIKGGARFISENVDVIIVEISLMRDESWENQALFDIFAILNELGFRLINVTDLNPTRHKSMLLAQMDCVFRHKRCLLADGND